MGLPHAKNLINLTAVITSFTMLVRLSRAVARSIWMPNRAFISMRLMGQLMTRKLTPTRAETPRRR
jgi:hypothetical protein